MSTNTTEATALSAQESEVLELLLTGGSEGFTVLLSQAAVNFTNGRVPQELSEEATEYVLEALSVYAEALDHARTAAFLMTMEAPAEVVNAISSEGVPFVEEFDRRKAEFVEKWPEYAEPVFDQPIQAAAETAEAAVASDVAED